MKTALIIPAYKPGEDMLALLERFRDNEAFVPVVVDDGSGEEFRKIFDRVPSFAVLLRHPQNRGKGAAMKTAMQYVLENLPECGFALTADADGQHRYADILRVNASAIAHPGTLVLGSRKMVGDNIPLRSRLGNGITRAVFSVVAGTRVYDTQTGLRAYDRAAMEKFVKIPGDRYEYEINELLEAAQGGMPILEETIETVYENDNASSHFNPLRDSLRIYLCILKFACSSLLAFVIDYVMVLVLNALLKGMPEARALLISVIGARVVSSTVNFLVNRKLVFKGNESIGRAYLKYAVLCVCILAANYALLNLFNLVLDWPLALAKIVVEALLFVGSLVAQGKLVYRKNTKSK